MKWLHGPASRQRGGYAICVIGLAAGLLGSGCDSSKDKTQLRVFMADSLSRTFSTLAKSFEQSHPDVTAVQIPSGSVLAAKKLTDGNDRADVLAVADYQVIDRLLVPDHAEWYICFATNEIGIAYTDASKDVTELRVDNWWQILSREGTKAGAANPSHDPCGYWTELCWQLADRHYSAGTGGKSITATMHAVCGEPDSRRSDSEQLLQLLESAGGIDYAFVYRSQALQHNLSFLRLPPEINLGDERFTGLYEQAEVALAGRTPGTVARRKGEPITYAVTIPRAAKYQDAAMDYISFLLSAQGRSILAAEHLNPVERPWTYDGDKLPPALRAHVDMRQRRPASTSAKSRSHDQ